jgi:hypothetical protein
MNTYKDTLISYKTNDYATHQPFLWHYLKKTKKPILELGSGYGSTPLIHLYSEHFSIPVSTLDHDWVWLGRFKNYQTSLHELIYVDVEENGWQSYIDAIPNKEWGVVFIDQGSWQSRVDTARFLRDKADYVIIHDVDALSGDYNFGKTIKKINNELREEGILDFSSEFAYSRTFWPKKPWPMASGPPTLVASMKYDIPPFSDEDYTIEKDTEEYKKSRNQNP